MFEGGYSLGQLLAGEGSERAIWRSQYVGSGQRGPQRLSGVLH